VKYRMATSMTGLLCLGLLTLVLGLNALALSAQPSSTIRLTDVTQQTGILFQHTDGSSGGYYIVETICAGLALFDYDNDGDEDIYFLNGGAIKGSDFKVVPRNALYRNDGDWRFTDVTQASGLGDPGHALGVAVADYDSDGDLDVYVTNFGPNKLFSNNGNGSFADVTQRAGVGDGHKLGAGACFLDMDQDGDLDLFSSSYVDFAYERHRPETMGGHRKYDGPNAWEPTPDTLYRNNGDGSFTDVSEATGIAQSRSRGMGTVCFDYDGDGDTDIYVASDTDQNLLFNNDGAGRFEEVGLAAGAGYDMNGDEMGSMGVGCGDFNNDGFLDLYVTAYQQEFPSLYENMGDGFFEDVTFLTGAGAGTVHTVTWGNDFADFDNDGDRDLFVALGHLMDNVELWDKRASYLACNILFMNTGKGKFVNVSDHSGNGMEVKLSSRGVAFDDLDKDGDVDVVVLNSRAKPTLLRNDSPALGHWLQVKLRGSKMNRDGIGARVKVIAGDLTLLDEVHSGRGYQSHYGMRLHFGLGKHQTIDRVDVRWVGGGTDVYRNIAVDQRVTLSQGGTVRLD
jgi:enediyne biosynthesis protein E4